MVANVPPPTGLTTSSEPSKGANRRRIPEMYTAMLMEVGGLYDRLLRAYARGGRSVEEIRLQFDAESEVMGLSVDLCRLREAAASAGVPLASDGFTTLTGMGASIDDVWAEVVERAVAFRELVESVESRADTAVAEAKQMVSALTKAGAK